MLPAPEVHPEQRRSTSMVVRNEDVLYTGVMRHVPRAQVSEGLIGWKLSGF